MTWDWAYAASLVPALLEGLLVTVEVTLLASALALVLGLGMAIVWRLRVPVLSPLLLGIARVIRGTPLLVQLYIIFFLLPEVLPALSPMVSAVIGLGVNYSTYMAEAVRAGLDGVPAGQWEVATALNLSPRTTWMRVVLPQTVPPTLPVIGNYVNSMFKVSALVSAISVVDVFNAASIAGNQTYRYLEPFTMVGLLYLVVSVPVTALLRMAEVRVARRLGSQA
ncbi:MAG: ectoine/hydroxyectoine ABC transporter permease subunit EhuD [Pseudonocardia sp.]|nr:ectoine/hydroxyectoine ABC transporter permease subunit EhuD [Pseudonocardia sp.]